MSPTIADEPGSAVADNRKSERHLTFQTRRTGCSDETFLFDCAILNISDHSACILVPLGATVPEFYTLRTGHDKAIHECKLAWREGARIGALSVDNRRSFRRSR
jgi:hypothetical protein